MIDFLECICVREPVFAPEHLSESLFRYAGFVVDRKALIAPEGPICARESTSCS